MNIIENLIVAVLLCFASYALLSKEMKLRIRVAFAVLRGESAVFNCKIYGSDVHLIPRAKMINFANNTIGEDVQVYE